MTAPNPESRGPENNGRDNNRHAGGLQVGYMAASKRFISRGLDPAGRSARYIHLGHEWTELRLCILPS